MRSATERRVTEVIGVSECGHALFVTPAQAGAQGVETRLRHSDASRKLATAVPSPRETQRGRLSLDPVLDTALQLTPSRISPSEYAGMFPLAAARQTVTPVDLATCHASLPWTLMQLTRGLI